MLACTYPHWVPEYLRSTNSLVNVSQLSTHFTHHQTAPHLITVLKQLQRLPFDMNSSPLSSFFFQLNQTVSIEEIEVVTDNAAVRSSRIQRRLVRQRSRAELPSTAKPYRWEGSVSTKSSSMPKIPRRVLRNTSTTDLNDSASGQLPDMPVAFPRMPQRCPSFSGDETSFSCEWIVTA